MKNQDIKLAKRWAEQQEKRKQELFDAQFNADDLQQAFPKVVPVEAIPDDEVDARNYFAEGFVGYGANERAYDPSEIQLKPKGNKIKHLVNIPSNKWCKGDVGVEIEVEGEYLPSSLQVGRYWHTTYDGSLADCGREYVMKQPQGIGFARCALKYFGICCKQNKAVLHDSIRAGVHVHINVQDLTRKELFNFIILFVIFEEALVRYCGSNREGNLFCLRIRDAQYLLHLLVDVANTGHLHHFDDDEYRYGAMNVKAVVEHGSLEFRSMRSTENMKAIGDWADMLLHLREYAKKYKDPRDIVNQFSGIKAADFALKVFGSLAGHIVTQHDLQETCLRGVRHAQDIAYAYQEV